MNKRENYIKEIELAEDFHFRQVDFFKKLQWATLIPVAIAGALTAFAGTPSAKETFMSYPESLLVTGIVTALGASINQLANFSERISRNRAAALGHRIVRQRLLYGNLSIEKAIALEKRVYSNPEAALEDMGNQPNSE